VKRHGQGARNPFCNGNEGKTNTYKLEPAKPMHKILTLAWLILVVWPQVSLGENAAAPPLTLEEAKEMAKKSSPTLQAAQETLHQTELLIDKAWTMVKPQWTATGTYTHYNTGMSLTMPDFYSIGTSEEVCGDFWNPDVGFCFTRFEDVTIQKQDSFNFYTTITQPLFIGQAISTIKSAYKAYDLAQINTANMTDYLLYTLEVAYYGAMTAKKFAAISENAVQIRKEHLKVARAKFEAGETTKITVLSAEISLNSAEQDLKSAENALALAKESIQLLIGRRADFTLVPPTPPKRPEGNLEQHIAEAMGKRRDLVAAQLNLELAEQAKADAWYRFLPSLVAVGNLRVADVKGFTNEYMTWNIGLALSIPLYDGGLRYAYLDEAKSKMRAAEIGIRQTKDNIVSEIHQLWLKLEMAEAKLDKAHQSVELAREQVSLAKASFEAGATTNLEVLDANAALFISEMNEAQEELNQQLAILRLQKALVMYNPAGMVSTGSTSASSSAPAQTGSSSQASGGGSGMGF
jgi:outer membrane protein TolC